MHVKREPLRTTLVGNVFTPIGIGRALRLAFSSCRAVGIETQIRDVWGVETPEESQAAAMLPYVTDSYGTVNVIHQNGDQVETMLEQLGPLPAGHNIIVPFWELPRYPESWVSQLERFDEVWAVSNFIRQSVAAVVRKPVLHMPLATEIALSSFCSRRHFGISENSYVFLFFFDCRSYIMRKNPQAVVECFRRLIAARPWARTHLVIKLHGLEAAPADLQDFVAGLQDLHDRVVLLTAMLPEVDVYNLIRCSDSFVSLHRAEGFGLGLAEAMYLGLPAIGTGWSGNMDFMTPENSAVVDYRLVPVPAGGYPNAEDQHWAEPDLDMALSWMIKLVDDPELGRRLGARGSATIRTGFSYRAAGLRYARRLAEIADMMSVHTRA